MAMQAQTTISEGPACRLAGISRTVLSYQQSETAATVALRARLVELAAERR